MEINDLHLSYFPIKEGVNYAYSTSFRFDGKYTTVEGIVYAVEIDRAGSVEYAVLDSVHKRVSTVFGSSIADAYLETYSSSQNGDSVTGAGTKAPVGKEEK